MEQQLGFITAPDGVSICYATVGEGPPLVKAPNWLSHLEFDWQDAAKRSFFEALARNNTLVRYDKHGCGLSDRDRTEFSLESEVELLEGLIDHVAPEPLALLGISQAGPIALAYAVRHPERVSHLILYGAYSKGARIAADDLRESMLSLVRAHWGIGSKTLADMFMPGSDAAAVESFATNQRKAATAEMASQLLDLTYRIDVTDLLAQVRVPTVVIHRDRDRAMPFHLGRELASSIPDVRLVPLDGRIHFPWLGDSDSVLFTDPVVTALVKSYDLRGVSAQSGFFFDLSHATTNPAKLGQNTLPIAGITRICLLFSGCLSATTVEVDFTQNGTRGVGIGGTITAGNTTGFFISLHHAPWRLAPATLLQSTVSGIITMMATGYVRGPLSNTSTAAKFGGTIQLIAPSQVFTEGVPGGFSARQALFTRLTLNFVPEPGLLLLLGPGVVSLALLGRRRMRS